MRFSLSAVLPVLFLLLAAFPEPSFAMLCGRAPSLVVGHCSKTHCSKAFQVEDKFLGHECSTRTVVSDPETRNLASMLKTSSMLTEEEQLVLFVWGRACWSEHEKNKNHEPLYYYAGEHCYFLLTAPSADASLYEKTRLGHYVSMEKFRGKSYEDLLKTFHGKERMGYFFSILELYIIPLVILPLLLWLTMQWMRKTVFSSLHWVFKILLVIPPILFHLIVLAHNLLATQYSFIMYQVGPPLFMVGMYLYYLFRPRSHRYYGRDASGSAKERETDQNGF